MKIAIIGTGIAGNVAAYHLRKDHDITVFESNDYVGGHTNTVEVEDDGRRIAVDTGFIVFNDRTYPNFLRLLDEIGQDFKKSVMSFSVQSARTGLEYNGSSLNGLFAQRANLVRPSFLRMVRDILRFNGEAPSALYGMSADMTVGDYLANGGYSRVFMDNYLGPMAAAIWSAEPVKVAEMPLVFVLRFFQNHGLLQLRDRPLWQVVEGGSKAYVDKLVAGHRDRIRLSTPVESLRRSGSRVQLNARGLEAEQFDHVFVACHSDQALAMLADPTDTERAVLGAIPYQENEAVLHTDRSLMPASKRCWAAWNYHIPAERRRRVSVTYNMNMLQGLDTNRDYYVTLNNTDAIAPESIIYRTRYDHPVYSLESIAAQSRHRELNSGNMTSYCGAYWRNGFHEDGVFSALEAIRHFEEEQHGKLHFRRAG